MIFYAALCGESIGLFRSMNTKTKNLEIDNNFWSMIENCQQFSLLISSLFNHSNPFLEYSITEHLFVCFKYNLYGKHWNVWP